MTPTLLALEELSVGQRFLSGTHLMEADAMVAFARAFDPQPFHLDPAAQSLFNGLAASGWYTAAVTMRLLVDGGLPFLGGIIGAGAEISWPRPTRPGDRLQVESEIVALTPSRSQPDRGMATVCSTTRNQLGEEVQRLISKVVVRRLTARASEIDSARSEDEAARDIRDPDTRDS